MKKYLFIFIFFFSLFYTSHTIAQQYARVVALAPSLTKNIYFLNSQDQLVGCTSYCQIAVDDNKEIVASAISVNVEKVISLQPDLVVVTTITNPETIELLRSFEIEVEVFSSPKTFEEICSQFIRLGSLLGKKAVASAIVDKTREDIRQLDLPQKSAIQPKIFFQIGSNPIFTVIPNTFMDDYIKYINGVNIASDLTRGTITRESVISRNPDIIFIVTMGIVGEEEKEIWESFSNLNASKNQKIFIIDSDLACTPTPITFLETLKILSNCINN